MDTKYYYRRIAKYVRGVYRKMRILIIVLSILILLYLAASLLIYYPHWKIISSNVDPLSAQGIELENSIRATIAQIFGGIAIIAGVFVTVNNLFIAKESHITERFTKAVEQLGSDNLAICLGGIYSLERIAKDSSKDYLSVIEILTMFIRQHRAWENKFPEDMQAILKVLGRRSRFFTKGENQLLSLSGANLQGAKLTGGHFEGFDFTDTKMQEATCIHAKMSFARFYGTNLSRAVFIHADLNKTTIIGADMRNAVLWEADLSGADISYVDFSGASFDKAILVGCKLSYCNLERATGLTKKQIQHVQFVDSKLPDFPDE
ncbi:MAG: pentapeptide repeat-containing protein [Armatimonadota bacterium]